MALDLKIGTIVFCCPDEDKKGEKDFAITKAKEYIKGDSLTNKDVRLYKKKGVIFVETIREFAL